MSDLSRRDLRALLDVVYALNDDPGGAEMPNQVTGMLGALVGCDSLSYNRVEHTTGRLLGSTIEPADMDISGLAGFHAVFDQHPGFAAYRSGRIAMGTSAALTDLTDLHTLRRLSLYTDFYRPRGVNDQLLCVVDLDNRQGSVLSFGRARPGFSRRDRAVVDLAAEHLSQAVARRQRLAHLTAAVRSLGRHSDQVEQAGRRLSALTARERQVAEYLVGGITDREIARSLAISPRTVHKHLESVYRKLGLGNRTSLIALIHQTSEVPAQRLPQPEQRQPGPVKALHGEQRSEGSAHSLHE